MIITSMRKLTTRASQKRRRMHGTQMKKLDRSTTFFVAPQVMLYEKSTSGPKNHTHRTVSAHVWIYKFAVLGVASIGNYIVEQLLKDKAAGIVKDVILLTRQGSNTAVQDDVKVTQIDYSNDESIKHALTGMDVIIRPVPIMAVDIQFGAVTEEDPEDIMGRAKGNIQGQLKALDMPYAAFCTGPRIRRALDLYITSGKVSVGDDGNEQISFTSRPGVCAICFYVLTHPPPEQLKDRVFTIADDDKSFNQVFKVCEEKTGKKLQVAYIPVSELETRMFPIRRILLSTTRVLCDHGSIPAN
ncbi:hypothetical protein F5888DRAFT_1807766 [Russula emetica]|nr:hypothetical protein F5888DRAFT_1807766 [Russula emetica]